MKERGTPHALLDARVFPTGNMLLRHFDELGDGVVAFHANYNDRREQKVEMLRDMGLWYLSDLAG